MVEGSNLHSVFRPLLLTTVRRNTGLARQPIGTVREDVISCYYNYIKRMFCKADWNYQKGLSEPMLYVLVTKDPPHLISFRISTTFNQDSSQFRLPLMLKTMYILYKNLFILL